MNIVAFYLVSILCFACWAPSGPANKLPTKKFFATKCSVLIFGFDFYRLYSFCAYLFFLFRLLINAFVWMESTLGLRAKCALLRNRLVRMVFWEQNSLYSSVVSFLIFEIANDRIPSFAQLFYNKVHCLPLQQKKQTIRSRREWWRFSKRDTKNHLIPIDILKNFSHFIFPSHIILSSTLIDMTESKSIIRISGFNL